MSYSARTSKDPSEVEGMSSTPHNVNAQGIKARDDRDIASGEDFGFCSYLLTGLSYVLTVLFFPFALCTNIKVTVFDCISLVLI